MSCYNSFQRRSEIEPCLASSSAAASTSSGGAMRVLLDCEDIDLDATDPFRLINATEDEHCWLLGSGSEPDQGAVNLGAPGSARHRVHSSSLRTGASTTCPIASPWPLRSPAVHAWNAEDRRVTLGRRSSRLCPVPAGAAIHNRDVALTLRCTISFGT